MLSSRYLDLLLHTSRCRGSIAATRHVWRVPRASFATSAQRSIGPAYVQKPDKSHPVPNSSIQPAKASQTALKSKGKKTATLKKAEQRKEREALTLEEQMEEAERITAMQHILPFDIWSQPIGLFDLRIPSLTSKRKDASIMDHLKAFWHTQLNGIKNAQHMWAIAKEDSFPGVPVESANSFQLFKVQTTPWLAPFRTMALQTYEELNNALASGDDKTLKRLAIGDYHAHLAKLVRAHNPSHIYAWSMSRENSSCKVVSIRAPEMYLAPQRPKFGNRLLIQALVRFDTMQSLKIYNKNGALIGGDEKPRHVVEYLVFQKRMWYDSPWVIRDQLFESLDGKYA